MADDWEWRWASESGRDRILRDELEGLQAQSAMASARSARLNSQLAHLQGSMETRLAALSAAFDAYVELGDIREQLAGYPETAAIRRSAAVAIDQLSRAGTAELVSTRGVEYWLPHAVNAVIGWVQGTPDPDAERTANELDRDAELFIVAAVGALGKGEQVATRLPELLVSDGSLTPHQLALWTASCAGVYGGVLPEIGRRWRSALDADHDVAAWSAWLLECSGSAGAAEALRWLDRETTDLTSLDEGTREAGPSVGPRSDPPAAGPAGAAVDADPTARLRAVVAELVGRGMPGEAELLERSRDLRRRIEAPGPVHRDTEGPGGPLSGVAEEEGSTTVVDAVRQAFLAATSDAVRRELMSWMRKPLTAAVGALAGEATDAQPVAVSARTPGGIVPISLSGPLPVALVRARANVEVKNALPRAKLYGSAVLAGALGLLALLAVVLTESVALPVTLLISALIAAAVALATLRECRARRDQQAADLAKLETTVTDAVAAAQDAEGSRQRRNADLLGSSEALRARLGSDQAWPGVSRLPVPSR